MEAAIKDGRQSRINTNLEQNIKALSEPLMPSCWIIAQSSIKILAFKTIKELEDKWRALGGLMPASYLDKKCRVIPATCGRHLGSQADVTCAASACEVTEKKTTLYGQSLCITDVCKSPILQFQLCKLAIWYVPLWLSQLCWSQKVKPLCSIKKTYHNHKVVEKMYFWGGRR